jgi:hypothetical protein
LPNIIFDLPLEAGHTEFGHLGIGSLQLLGENASLACAD